MRRLTTWMVACVVLALVGWAGFADDDTALLSGGLRLEALQNDDGGWDWPLDDGNPANTSPTNTVGPIAMGLAQAYWNEAGGVFGGSLVDAGTLLLGKTNNFSPSDGYLATMLDSIFGGSAYRDHVSANFYGPLAAGTYNKSGSGTLYDTASYVQLIRDSRANGGIGNLAAWDIGMGLVGAAACGAGTSEWVVGVKSEIDELDSNAYYDVIGLAGAVLGLAYVSEDYDPTAGEHASASSLYELAEILAGYQIAATGGFTWNAAWMDENSDETVQETAYAILALNEIDRIGFLDEISAGADWLVDVQLGTGGWINYPYYGGGENNEVTAEAMWGIHATYVDEIWVDDSGDDAHFGYGFLPLATAQLGVSLVQGFGGTVHLADGTYVGQVVIDGDVVLEGTGSGTVIEAPTTLTEYFTTSSKKNYPVVLIRNGADATLQDLVVDGAGQGNGNYRFIGIGFHNAEGLLENVEVRGVRDTPFSGSQHGVAIYAYNEDGVQRTIIVRDSWVHDFQKNAFALSGDGLTVDIDGNVVEGAGVTDVTAQNGIQVGYGAGGVIQNNVVQDIWWDGPTWTASGLLVGGTAADLEIISNDVLRSQTGLYLYDTTGQLLIERNVVEDGYWNLILYNTPGAEVHYNAISGSGDGSWTDSNPDTTLNWWGSADGPTADVDEDGTFDYIGGGEILYGDFIFSPWLGMNPDGDAGTPGVQLVSPMLFVVDDVGPAPSDGYLGTAIIASNELAGNDAIEVRGGSFDASEPVTEGVELYSAGGASETTLTGAISIHAPEVLLGGFRQGFSINGPITVGSGIDAETIHINWNDIYGIVTNDGLGVLDATFNYWGEDGPDTVGLVNVGPTLPEPTDKIIGYMDLYILSAADAIAFSNGVLAGLAATDALFILDVLEVFPGLSFAEVEELLDEYGRSAVRDALIKSGGDWDAFVGMLIGYGVGGGGGGAFLGGGGGGSLSDEGIFIFAAGEIVPLQIELFHPITGELVEDAFVSFSVSTPLEDGTPVFVTVGAMVFDSDLGSYVFDLDTTGYAPGVYDIYITTGGGHHQYMQIEII